MTKGEFITKLNIATQVANTAFSRVGLTAKRFTKTFNEEYADLLDEQYFIKKDFAELDEKGQAKKDQQGNLILDSSKEKEMVTALKLWNKEPFEVDFSKFKLVKLTGKELFMSAVIFDELNGYVFDINEEEYLNELEAEIIRQNEQK